MRPADRPSYLAAVDRLGDADAVIARVLDVAGVRQFALDALLRLSGVEWSDQVGTACVECVDSPRLLLNPCFIESHCQVPRALAFLLLHELAHVSLGHTGLHARVTPIQNVAFDAFINASLLQGIVNEGRLADRWDALVTTVYAADRSPEFILRPPPCWPDAPDWEASANLPSVLRTLHQRLYDRAPSGVADGGTERDRWLSVTYGELIRALTAEQMATNGDGDDTPDGVDGVADRLLGAHGATETERAATSGGRDANAAAALGEVLAQLPRDPAANRADGGDPFDIQLGGRCDDQLMVQLRALIRRALVDGGDSQQWQVESRSIWTVDPSRDRRAHVRRHVSRAMGTSAPMLFHGATTQRRPRVFGGAAIYLDVSGSMGDWVNRLHAALIPLRRLLAPQLFVFSTDVCAYSRDAFVRGRVRSTGGTDITPVLRHLLTHAAPRKIERALLLTDGYVGTPARALAREFIARKIALHVGLVGTCRMDTPPWAASITTLKASTPR